MSTINELEVVLREKYNDYIDSLVSYLEDIKENGGSNNAVKYLLDNHVSMGLRNTLEIVYALDTERVLAKKAPEIIEEPVEELNEDVEESTEELNEDIEESTEELNQESKEESTEESKEESTEGLDEDTGVMEESNEDIAEETNESIEELNQEPTEELNEDNDTEIVDETVNKDNELSEED